MADADNVTKIELYDKCRQILAELPPIPGPLFTAQSVATMVSCNDVTAVELCDDAVPAARMEARSV